MDNKDIKKSVKGANKSLAISFSGVGILFLGYFFKKYNISGSSLLLILGFITLWSGMFLFDKNYKKLEKEKKENDKT